MSSPPGPRRVLLSWSSGKDSAWALHILREQPDVEVVGLLTTVQEDTHRVPIHGVPAELAEAQATAAGLPLRRVPIPFPCPNAVYEARVRGALAEMRHDGVTGLAFGDLYLADIRQYRETLLAGTGIAPLFPLWCPEAETPQLARTMLAGGLGAVLTAVDARRLPATFVGRRYDDALLAELPPGVDPCGEAGELHTFCFAGPMFEGEVTVSVGETVERDGHHVATLSGEGP